MRIVFFGTPPFAAETLRYLLAHDVDVAAVVTRPDKPKGRSQTPQHSAVKIAAAENNLPVHQPEKASDPTFAPILEQYQADFFIVVAYGEIIKQNLLDMPKRACINVHASLLPKYRGAAPIQHAIINGEKKSGVTIMHMVLKMDAGEILKQVSVPIPFEMTGKELEKELQKVGERALLNVLQSYDTIKPIAQDESLATHAPKITSETCQIDWSNSAKEIHNLVRAVSPNAWCTVSVKGESKRLKVIQTALEEGPLTVPCGEGTLSLLTLQLEGKKALSATDFIRGIKVENISFL